MGSPNLKVTLEPAGKRGLKFLIYAVVNGRKREVGYLNSAVTRNITKHEVLAAHDDYKLVKRIFKQVPDEYTFNYYWLQKLFVYEEYSGLGIGSAALQVWFTKLRSIAMVALEAYPIGYRTKVELERFYLKNNFVVFHRLRPAGERQRRATMAMTFVKA
jgi:GNAT superfamily N-acetyltransferase